MLQKLRRDNLLVAEGRGQGCVYRFKDGSSEGQMEQALPRKLRAEDMEYMVCLFCREWRAVQEIASHVLLKII